jgi:hypothetical protein
MVVLILVAFVAAACGSGTGPAKSTSSGTLLLKPLPAGKNPSEIAIMVCAKKAQREIGEVLGVTALVKTPTWADHLYKCLYSYSDGSFMMSVKELSSWTQTFAYYRGLGSELGNTGSIKNLGQGAFATKDGSVVVRKDWKVLLVDISGLPGQFGVPPTSSADVAVTIADVILGCWSGD